jgi:hypothetical protein
MVASRTSPIRSFSLAIMFSPAALLGPRRSTGSAQVIGVIVGQKADGLSGRSCVGCSA